MIIPSGLKKFILGIVVGGAVAFHLGINFGRNMPLLTNPYQQDVVQRVKQEAGKAVEQTRDAIHQATEPARKEVEKQMGK
ncbi:MAG: hypothetical protein OEW21_03700 [Betaproteobacteria bacterium]|nr:hypothetical protein [Betaproteobacteria bacterium]